MENNNIQESQDGDRPAIRVVNGEAKPSSGKKAKVLLSLAAVLLVAGLGSTGYLYTQEKTDNKQLSSEVEDLDGKVESLKQEAIEQAEGVEKKEALQTVYEAEVGKFTLTLPSEYYVVEEIDGGYEGGPITQASIGFPTEAENVISTDVFKTVEISARPSEQKNFKADVENALGTDAKKVETIKIDGVNADMYDVAGLSDSSALVFFNNKVFYKISSTVKSKDINKLIVEIVKGFKFNKP